MEAEGEEEETERAIQRKDKKIAEATHKQRFDSIFLYFYFVW
jgi:hypothetical protein